MKIYLVRHGETDWNLQERMQGQADNPLNDTGRKQAQIVADKLRGITFDAAFSSTLCRAAATAEIILGQQKDLLQKDARVMEIGFGPWEGEKISRVMNEAHPLHNFLPDLTAIFRRREQKVFSYSMREAKSSWMRSYFHWKISVKMY